MGEREWRVTAAVVLAAATGTGVVLAISGLPDPVPVPAAAPETADTGVGIPVDSTVGSAGVGQGSAGHITVHVAGAVARPGLVLLPAGARVADAIEAAGGATGPGPPALNLAALLADGAQVVVSGADDDGAAAPTDGSRASGPVPVNNADVGQLEALPGVGPVLAERIVAHRLAHGPFATVEDLLAVPGIGEAKLAALRDLVAVP